MRIAVIQFPGSNCERETGMAIKRAEMEPVYFLWNEDREKLRACDGYVIVGGFSYEDRSRAGIIAALDPIMQEIKAQNEKGKPILGICNGAQILVETGLVPGLENNKLAMALTENKRIVQHKILGTGFYNAWVHMRLSDQYQRNAFTRHLSPQTIIHLPIAHAQGRFVITDALSQEIANQGLNLFQYCDEKGNILPDFPINPNGSVMNMAAVSNKAGNVMAMMPHPERTINGDAIFQSMRDYISYDERKEERARNVIPLHYYPRPSKLSAYELKKDKVECITRLIITDNQALTVQNTLNQLGIPVQVSCFSHYEIQTDSAELEKIKTSGVLYNARKEEEVASSEIRTGNSLSLLVRAKEDLLGQEKRQMLKDHFDIQQLHDIKHGIIWQFTPTAGLAADWRDAILQTHIIYNPYSHDCIQYDKQSS
jgi:phosphoribosylformylglycinamidine synthase subunit PurQ / glutaminase